MEIVRHDAARRRSLLGAARLITRLNDSYDGELEIEGIRGADVVLDLLSTANEMIVAQATELALDSEDTFSKRVGELGRLYAVPPLGESA